MQFLSRYHRISTPLTRHPSGATSWRLVKHSCPHSFFIGQRVQFSSRTSVRPTVEVNDACSASTSTIAGLFVSGHVTMREIRYLEKDRTSHLMPNQRAAAKINMAINEPTAVFMFDPFHRLRYVRVRLAAPRSL